MVGRLFVGGLEPGQCRCNVLSIRNTGLNVVTSKNPEIVNRNDIGRVGHSYHETVIICKSNRDSAVASGIPLADEIGGDRVYSDLRQVHELDTKTAGQCLQQVRFGHPALG